MNKGSPAKKILLISSWAPPQVSGSANYLHGLFDFFPRDSYCLFTSKRNFKGEVLGDKLAGKYFFYEDGKVYNVPLFPYTYNRKTPIWTKIYQKLRRGLIYILRIFSSVRSGLKIIREERINLLIGASDNGPSFLLTLLLSALSGKPYALFVFDLYKGNDFSFPWKQIAFVFEPILFHFAKKLITVTEDLKSMYINKYGHSEKWHLTPLCMNEERYLRLTSAFDRSNVKNTVKTIVFTGNVYWVQHKSLENMVAAVDALDMDVNFKIYTPTEFETIQPILEKYNGSNRTSLKSATPLETPMIQASADILFLPLSWHTKNQTVVNTAMPFKTMEYLLSGTPLLIHAPKESDLARYAKKEKFALVIDEENIEALQSGIKKILTDKNFSTQLTSNAKATFYKNHQASKHSKILFEILQRI